MHISKHCTRPAHSIAPGATVIKAMRMMKEQRATCLVVVDEANRPIGILTGRDVAVKVVGAGMRANGVLVEAVMTQPVITISGRATIEEATRTLKSAAVRRLPVVGERGQLEGMVTAGDLVLLLWSDLNEFGVAMVAEQ